MRSNVPYTFDRRHRPAFELTCVCSSAAPHLTHTLLHACVRTYPLHSSTEPISHTHPQHECDRTHLYTIDHMRAEPSRDLFLGHCSSSPSLLLTAVQYLSLPSLFSPSHPRHKPPTNTTSTPPHHFPSPPHLHRAAVAPPLIPISPFLLFLTENPISPQPHFSSIFFACYMHIP
jgi:hypothetical protein